MLTFGNLTGMSFSFGNKPILSMWFGNKQFYPDSTTQSLNIESTDEVVDDTNI